MVQGPGAVNRGQSWSQWCGACRLSRSDFGVASSTPAGALTPSTAPGPGATVVGCLVGVYPCSSSSTGPRGPIATPAAPPHLLNQAPPIQAGNCRACCCHHQQSVNAPVQLTSQRGGLALRVARVASTTSVRAAPYAHTQHQALGPECR